MIDLARIYVGTVAIVVIFAGLALAMVIFAGFALYLTRTVLGITDPPAALVLGVMAIEIVTAWAAGKAVLDWLEVAR